jgi:glycosyltransferase involved in cell wall biosynthesis
MNIVKSGPSPLPPSLDDYAASPQATTCQGGKRTHQPAPEDEARPPVSIVTVVRNGVETLQRALRSVLDQEVPGLEYVVVDGGSTDGTLELLRAEERRLSLWTSEPDKGISDAFNKGIAFSRGEIIGLLNCDDWYEPGTVQAVLDEMHRVGADVACGRLQYWEGNRRTYLVASDSGQLYKGMTIGHPTVFVRRESYRRHGLFRTDFRLVMDYEWLLRAKTGGARFVDVGWCVANMQSGGIGDRRWRDSQREVARARALHVPGAGSAFAYHAYVARRIFLGTVRRMIDAAGLHLVRRAYHRWLSPVAVASEKNDIKR